MPGELKRLLAAGAIDDADLRGAPRRLRRRQAHGQAAHRARARSSSAAVVNDLEGVAARGQLTASRLPRAVPDAAAQPRVVDQRAAAELRAGASASPAPRSSGSTTPAPASRSSGSARSASSTRSGRARYDARRSARPSTSCCRWPPSAPAASPGSTTSPTARARPPWVSSLAQGTGAAGALARGDAAAAARTRCSRSRSRGLGIFEPRRPQGVRVPAGAGAHYLQYSFEPRPADPQRLHPVARRALRLRRTAGRRPRDARCSPTASARAREEVPTYDTGAWSLYSRGTVTHESDLGYHTLLRDFLDSLCKRTQTPVVLRRRAALHDLPDDAAGGRRSPPPAARRRPTGKLRFGSRRSPASRCGSRAARSSCTRATPAALSRGPQTLGWTVPQARRRLHGDARGARPRRQPGHRHGDVEVLKPRKKKRG